MTTAFEQFTQRIQQLSDLVDVRQRELDDMREKNARQREELDETTAKERRDGKYGRVWQVLQQRIDMGQTCERDIYLGLDTSPEAREAREQIGASLAGLRRHMASLDPDDPTARMIRQTNESVERP